MLETVVMEEVVVPVLVFETVVIGIRITVVVFETVVIGIRRTVIEGIRIIIGICGTRSRSPIVADDGNHLGLVEDNCFASALPVCGNVRVETLLQRASQAVVQFVFNAFQDQ